jgi:microcystin-dependent protein
MADPFLGEIRMFAGNYAPHDWAFCDGQLVDIVNNQALASLLSSIYGGMGARHLACRTCAVGSPFISARVLA